MRTYESRMIVTSENVEAAKDELNARDQNNELEVGCEVWNITHSGGCKGWMTIWPSKGRGAVEFGGDSVWGDWDPTKQLLYTEVYRDDGSAIVYDIYGAKLIRRRLDALRAAVVLEDLRNTPGRLHELRGDRKGQFSLDLDGPYRLLFTANHSPVPTRPEGGIDWTRITAVTILGVEDTHE